MKEVSIIIPAYKAEKTIRKTVASISTQTVSDKVEVIVCSDNPSDDYSFLLACFPDLDIKILPTKINTGAGLARQRGLDVATGKWAMFVDVDDLLADPFAIEFLLFDIKEGTVGVQSYFVDVSKKGNKYYFVKEMNVQHPWVFSRLYDISFLREHNIRFSDLRACEDTEFNWKFSYCVRKHGKNVKVVDHIGYYWFPSSDESITRIGEKNGVPQYTYDFCRIGVLVATKRFIDFMRDNKATEVELIEVILKCMLNNYVYYLSCLSCRKEFAQQNMWLAVYFYNEFYRNVENKIANDYFTTEYKHTMEGAGVEIDEKVLKKYPFPVWLDIVKSQKYHLSDIDKIRSKLDKKVKENDERYGFYIKCGNLFA